MVGVEGRGKPEQRLQQHVDVGRREQVHAARDVGDALIGIVDDDAQVVARRRLLADQHHVAPAAGLGGARPFLGEEHVAIRHRAFADHQHVADLLLRRVHVEPPLRGAAGGEPRLRLAPGEVPAGAGIDRRAVGIAPLGVPRDLGTRAEAGIEQARPPQLCGRFLVDGEALALPHHRLGEVVAEPGHVRADGGVEFGFAAGEIDVLDAQQRRAADGRRGVLREQRGIGVAQVQVAVRAWRKAENRLRWQDVLLAPPLA